MPPVGRAYMYCHAAAGTPAGRIDVRWTEGVEEIFPGAGPDPVYANWRPRTSRRPADLDLTVDPSGGPGGGMAIVGGSARFTLPPGVAPAEVRLLADDGAGTHWTLDASDMEFGRDKAGRRFADVSLHGDKVRFRAMMRAIDASRSLRLTALVGDRRLWTEAFDLAALPKAGPALQALAARIRDKDPRYCRRMRYPVRVMMPPGRPEVGAIP